MPWSNGGSSQMDEGVHPVELSVYSVLSADLDGIQQSINDLRQSQAILIVFMKKINESLKCENKYLYDPKEFKSASKRLKLVQERLNTLNKKYDALLNKNKSLVEQFT